MRWLMPRDDTFFVLFERSAATMVEAAEALQSLFSGGPIDDASFKLSYLEFPVLARINLPLSTATVRLLTGPTFAFNVNESIKVGGVELDGDEVPLKPFEMGFALGGAVEIRKFVIDGRYTWGLTDINDSDDDDEPTVKNGTFSLTFGWIF